MSDFWARRFIYKITQESSLLDCEVKLDINRDSFIKLAKTVPLYNQKSISKVLPLSMFDDFKEESLAILKVINERRMRNKLDMKIRALIQDSFGDETVTNAVV